MRHKYRHPGPNGRKEAEAALIKSERGHRLMYWFSVALIENRITWTERDAEGYRFAAFIAVPSRSSCNPEIVVAEFSPSSSQQMPSLHVMDDNLLYAELAARMRFNDTWFIQGVEAAQHALRLAAAEGDAA